MSGTNKVGTNKVGTNKVGTNKVGTNKVGTNKVGTNKVGTNKVGTNETIYKISHIDNNTTKTIYVFIGKYKELNKLFQKDPGNAAFANIFLPEELDDIAENDIQVKFIPDRLHLDDTIEVIKKKILLHLQNDLNISFDELYCFTRQYEQFNAIALYQNLTQNEKLELTRDRLLQFLLNVPELDINMLEDKPVYTFSDIVKLNLEQTPLLVMKPLGQKMVSLNAEYPYTINPFDAEVYDSFLEKFAEDITTTTNTNILMQYGKIEHNTIYLCLADDVLSYANNNNLSENSTVKIYFPYLYGKDILNKEQLDDQKQALLGESRTLLNNVFQKNCDNINLFYDIYANRSEEMNFRDVGIKSIIFTIHPLYAFNLPLDIVFKLIHATQDVPLIKMNLSKNQEKIYRLYADKIATNGKKIPYLDKGTIFKWDKVIGRSKSVAVYIEHSDEGAGSVTPIICEFENTGNITIKANFHESMTIDAMNEVFLKEVNPVINIVKEYLMQNGYNMSNFIDIKDKNVEILNIDYVMHIQIEKQIKVKNIIGCVSSMFNLINDDLEQGIMLRFKRVANYNEMESQEALILDMSKPHLNYTDNDIIKVLQSNFHLSEAAARTKYAEVKRAQEVMETANKKLKSRNNPGFLTTIVKQPFKNVIMINVSGINNIGYLDTLYIYLDSLIRITQKQTSTKVKNDIIKNSCKGNKIDDEKHVEEIIAIAEQPRAENVVMNIVAEELVFNKPNEQVVLAEEEREAEGAEAEGAEAEVEGLEVEATEPELELSEEEMLARFGYGEEEDENENENEESGGAKGEEEEEEEEEEWEAEEEETLKTNVTGQSLSNPNPFSKRIYKRDKNLFYTEDGKKNFKSYSRTCPWTSRRQPVILTDEEKERIDNEHPGSYSQAVKYGSDPKKPFWYICPRYWNLKDNTSLRPDEVNTNEVISKKDKVVPAGKHIFEFNDYGIEYLDENKKYIEHYPGFLKPDKKGNCLPCCFKSWTGVEQTSRRAICTKEAEKVEKTGRKKKIIEEDTDEYILSHDKFPMLQQNRFGYLPLAIQKFLHTDNKKCQISELNTNIKPNHTCLLRHSIEISSTQSFIACIADIWFGSTRNKEKTRPTIQRMKEILIKALTIDEFVTLQNGNLLQIFFPSSDAEEAADENPLNDMENYAEVYSNSNSKLYEVADKTNAEQMNTLIIVAKAYKKFIDYLKDDTVEIDYTYLWDLICKPNPKLFPPGVNMVILELSKKDITDNVEILCPANHYSASFFESKKNAIIMLKVDNYYEPIYAYETKDDVINITRSFNLMRKDVLPNIKYTLNLIKKSLNNKCGALASMPGIYKFEHNIPLERLIHFLTIRNYLIQEQIINYESKVIGVVAMNKQTNQKGFIPCNPSAPILDTEVKWMDDIYADTYENTKAFLEQVYIETRKYVPCNPRLKVLEDGLIIGLLTMTNQFVQIKEPTQDTFGDDLKSINDSNYLTADKTIQTKNTVDDDRVNYIKNIQLETNFYNVFRNTVRYLLGQFQHNDIRQEIEEKSASNQLYLKKIQSIEKLLRDLMKDHVVFHQYEEAELFKLTNITNCYNSCKNKPYCQPVKENDFNECALMVPQTNLISKKSNDTFYFGKLADEIVRYNRIKSFIFNPKTVLTFTTLKYNLRENEIILLQSLLTQEYFEDIIAAPVNRYITSNSYDTTQPVKAQKYSNVETLEAFSTPEIDLTSTDPCSLVKKAVITSNYWRAVFPENYKEILYQSNPTICSFSAFLTLLKDYSEEYAELTRNALKEVLLTEFLTIYPTYAALILNVLKAQGKKILSDQVKQKQLSITNMIISEDYYATNLDIWLLAIHYNLPLIMLSSTSLLENNKNFMVFNSTGSTEYYFLKVGATFNAIPPSYTVITDAQDRYKIDINTLRARNIQEEFMKAPVGNRLIYFIENFSLKFAQTRKKIVAKPGIKPAAVPSAAAPAEPTAADTAAAAAAPAEPTATTTMPAVTAMPSAAAPAEPTATTTMPAVIAMPSALVAPAKKMTKKLKIAPSGTNL
jgi:hypothetical protein